MGAERRVKFRWMEAYWSIPVDGWLKLQSMADNYRPFNLDELGAREITKPKGRVEQLRENK